MAGSRAWRKCPICFDSVSANHLKPALIEQVCAYKPGDSMKMTLMYRYKHSTVSLTNFFIFMKNTTAETTNLYPVL